MFQTLLEWVKKAGILPRISETERAALDAGSVWIEGEFFSGKPDFDRMLTEAYPQLRPEEQAFLDGPCEELCRMIDPWEIHSSRRVPEPILKFMAENGFYALNIPREYGGKAFSALAKSTVLSRLTGLSSAIYNYVSIPNSIGSPELIADYGTEEQKKHYLPKLATGEYYSCFALTEPTAGSDATSIKAEAVVFKDKDGETKLRLNFRKRYITMAPVANLISLACRVRDPDDLLGKGEDVGITVVLLHEGEKGLHIGDRHDPLGVPFPNGPIEGRDVVVPVDNIIGGPERAGQGWRMLMEALSGGRMISLPASAIGGAIAAAGHVGRYSMVREQFGIPIGHMEGVRERVARVAALSYMLEAARIYSVTAVDNGHRPSVVSALMKYGSTDLSRVLTDDALDVFGGAGIMRGPNNLLHEGYAGVPIGITVEGANILTRTLITFGQGTVRCHPHALDVVAAVENDDVDAFRQSVLGWARHFAEVTLRALVHGLTRGLFVRTPGRSETARYYRRLAWSSARFALLTNLLLFFVGGELKARGKLSGRMADILTWQFFAIATLRRYRAEDRRQEDLPLVRWSLDYAFARIQESFEAVYANFPGYTVGLWLRTAGLLGLRLNPIGRPPSDELDAAAAGCIQRSGSQLDRLTAVQFQAPESDRGAGRLRRAFRLDAETRPLRKRLHEAVKDGQVAAGDPQGLVGAAVEAGVLSTKEANLLRDAEAAKLAAVEVDEFTPEEFFDLAATPVESGGKKSRKSA